METPHFVVFPVARTARYRYVIFLLGSSGVDCWGFLPDFFTSNCVFSWQILQLQLLNHMIWPRLFVSFGPSKIVRLFRSEVNVGWHPHTQSHIRALDKICFSTGFLPLVNKRACRRRYAAIRLSCDRIDFKFAKVTTAESSRETRHHYGFVACGWKGSFRSVPRVVRMIFVRHLDDLKKSKAIFFLRTGRFV